VTQIDVPHDDRWALVTRVADSRHLEKAVQLRELLLYLAKRAITDPSVGVTEQEIGTNALGRRPDYDPQADNIVRVQIRHLRQRLEQYFLTDGQHEPVVMSIPKGSHVLRFERRPSQPAEVSPPRGKVWPWRLAAMIALTAIAFLLGRFSEGRTGGLTAGPRGASPLWTQLFLKNQPTTIVLADSSVVFVENVLGKNFTLSEYIDRSYREQIEAVPDAALRDALRMIANRQYTSLADATLSGELRLLGARMGARVAVRFARHMNVRDFNSGNFILIGSSHSVPWVELFQPSLNFRFEPIGKEPRYGFRNLRPLPGEAPIFEVTATPSGPQESFATLSLLPNLTRNGTVLLLAGVTMEATEAAGEFAMREDFPEVVAKTLGVAPGQKLPFFEILLRTVAVAGAPHKADVIAWRKPGN